MYGKIFTSMWDGSLYGKLEASAVLMACVTLCNAQGVLDMTPEAISGRTGWPVEFVRKGIIELEQPDPRSRTPDDDGRRLAKLDDHRDWGWLIVNYEKYRTLADPDVIKIQTRERVRKHREKRNGVKRSVTLCNAPKRQAEAEAEAEEGKRGNVASAPPAAKVGKPKGSKRVPPEFIPDVSLALAKLPNVDIEAEVTKFRDWEFKSARSDWAATWRNWVQSASEQGRYAKKKSNGEWSRVT